MLLVTSRAAANFTLLLAAARETDFVDPTRSYLICCVQRTGSWLLANTLADTGWAGRPSDYFDEAERESWTQEWGLSTEDLASYVRGVWDHATTPNGVLGSKMMWNAFDRLRSSLQSEDGDDVGLQFIRTTFPNTQFVWLRREDKVRQGVSWWRAVATDEWALTPDQRPARLELHVEQIVPLVRFAEQCENGWRQWFASTGVETYEVVYEDLARDRLGTVNDVLEFLDLRQITQNAVPPVRYRKQADELSEHYVNLVRAAMSTPD